MPSRDLEILRFAQDDRTLQHCRRHVYNSNGGSAATDLTTLSAASICSAVPLTDGGRRQGR